MKKNITINLCGRLFQIDEDAYELLQQYINSLRSSFGKQEGGDEIVGNACCDGRCVTKEEVERLIRQGFAANAAAGETDNMTAVLIRDCFSEK